MSIAAPTQRHADTIPGIDRYTVTGPANFTLTASTISEVRDAIGAHLSENFPEFAALEPEALAYGAVLLPLSRGGLYYLVQPQVRVPTAPPNLKFTSVA